MYYDFCTTDILFSAFNKLIVFHLDFEFGIFDEFLMKKPRSTRDYRLLLLEQYSCAKGNVYRLRNCPGPAAPAVLDRIL
ncbi:hypothetical protein ACET3Z_006837 [Daucus carota]